MSLLSRDDEVGFVKLFSLLVRLLKAFRLSELLVRTSVRKNERERKERTAVGYEVIL